MNLLKRQYVRNHLNRLDRVRIEGILKYKTQLDDKAKKKHFEYVSGTKIIKMYSAQEQNKSKKSPEDSIPETLSNPLDGI